MKVTQRVGIRLLWGSLLPANPQEPEDSCSANGVSWPFTVKNLLPAVLGLAGMTVEPTFWLVAGSLDALKV